MPRAGFSSADIVRVVSVAEKALSHLDYLVITAAWGRDIWEPFCKLLRHHDDVLRPLADDVSPYWVADRPPAINRSCPSVLEAICRRTYRALALVQAPAYPFTNAAYFRDPSMTAALLRQKMPKSRALQYQAALRCEAMSIGKRAGRLMRLPPYSPVEVLHPSFRAHHDAAWALPADWGEMTDDQKRQALALGDVEISPYVRLFDGKLRLDLQDQQVLVGNRKPVHVPNARAFKLFEIVARAEGTQVPARAIREALTKQFGSVKPEHFKVKQKLPPLLNGMLLPGEGRTGGYRLVLPKPSAPNSSRATVR